MDRDSLELLLAQGVSVERIARRFGRDPSTVSYWISKHGLTAPMSSRHASRGGVDRATLERLVGAGLSIAEISTELQRSAGTVRYWLTKFDLRTLNARGRRRRPSVVAGRDAGLLRIPMACPVHGQTEFQLEGRGYYRCTRCRSESVSRRRRAVKAILVDEAGGCCAICGYDRCQAALAFHHLDPARKRMAVSANGKAVAIESLRAEARKCVLLCHNCHSEVGAGLASVPIE